MRSLQADACVYFSKLEKILLVTDDDVRTGQFLNNKYIISWILISIYITVWVIIELSDIVPKWMMKMCAHERRLHETTTHTDSTTGPLLQHPPLTSLNSLSWGYAALLHSFWDKKIIYWSLLDNSYFSILLRL